MSRRRTTFQFNEDDRLFGELTERQPLIAQHKAPMASAEEARELDLMTTLDTLQVAANELFDSTNPQHMRTLQELWEFSFPGEPFSRSSPRWATLGFQGLDPSTDLRGAGYQGLCHLHHFVTSFQVLPLSCPSDFPLAIASINCTAILQSYFGLNMKVVVPVPDAIRRSCKPSNDMHHAFLELAAAHPQPTFNLQALHVQLLHALARQWARSHTPTTTIMDFPAVLQTTYRHFHLSMTATAKPWRLHELVANLQQPPWLAEHAQTPMISFLLMLVTQLGCCGCQVSDDHDDVYDYRPLRAPTTPRAPPLVAAL